MKSKRRHLSAEFKARVAKEAIKEQQTIAELATQFEVTPSQISQWKKELEDRMAELFAKSNKRQNEAAKQERQVERLERKVGQLVIEKEFLQKKCVQLGIDPSARP